MRFVCFKSPLRPNFVRLCGRHPRGESEGIVAWVLSMAGVWKLSLGRPPEKAYKTGKMNLGQQVDMSNLPSQGKLTGAGCQMAGR
jgi:hypothetical protein